MQVSSMRSLNLDGFDRNASKRGASRRCQNEEKGLTVGISFTNHLIRSRRSADGATEGDVPADGDETGDERVEPKTARSPWPMAH